MLRSLTISGIPPFRHETLEFGNRLNLITGDNGVGKTLILDLCWYALTRTWVDEHGVMIQPTQEDLEKGEPPWMAWTHAGRGEGDVQGGADYRLKDQGWHGRWVTGGGRSPLSGVVIYARVDGGFSVWDPLRNRSAADSDGAGLVGAYHFSRENVWQGLRDASAKDGRNLCNGLLRDVENWRLKGNGAFSALSAVLDRLSADGLDPLRIGSAIQIRLGDEDWIPTLQTRYGAVPVTQAAAGVKRVLSLAYLLVWAAESHKRSARLLGEEPEDHVILLFDEVEGHLHPRWQRLFLPSLMDVVSNLLREGQTKNFQIIATTHAPMVAASLESIFQPAIDQLFNLEMGQRNAEVEPVRWAKFGDATGWLTSPMFDMESGYSKEAEAAMKAADDFMAGHLAVLPPRLQTVEEIHAELARTLDAADPYWPFWLPFYREQGGKP
jgi:hypothetical protein